ncbi:MAG: OmpA family protein [Candidatus Omnitrophica bacterium]|nr:OmpA family protein [Candidatus Omnitrophota bacterium]MCM8770995.1 OmpA family protein [Candidatus Omnitrophota bacterium]
MNKKLFPVLSGIFILLFCISVFAWDIRTPKEERKAKREEEVQAMQEQFKWWPTDAKPAPVKDPRGGYWWWPTQPGSAKPWGNRGYIYLYKIIYDYKEEELPAAKPGELRPSLLIKKIIKNVKIYFDFDKSDLRPDHTPILESAVNTLKRNPSADILITGNCDIRGPESYNLKLGRRRAEAVKAFLVDKGIAENRIRIVSRGKLDAVAPITDLVGMQKDRNAQFVIAEVEEVMLPAPSHAEAYGAQRAEEGKYIIEEEKDIESTVKVATKEYVVKKGDTLWKIAQEQYGAGYRWKYLYELNKDKIKDPNKLKAGTKIIIPVE